MSSRPTSRCSTSRHRYRRPLRRRSRSATPRAVRPRPPPRRMPGRHRRRSSCRSPRSSCPRPRPSIPVAPVAALGTDSAAGAADAGTGTGAGGEGNGRGAGAGGNGTGAGGTPARLIRGAITDRDYPPEARRAGIEGNLTTRYLVGPDGRIERCYVTESSGSPNPRRRDVSPGHRPLPLRPRPRRGRPSGRRHGLRRPRLGHAQRRLSRYSAASSSLSASAACSAHISA